MSNKGIKRIAFAFVVLLLAVSAVMYKPLVETKVKDIHSRMQFQGSTGQEVNSKGYAPEVVGEEIVDTNNVEKQGELE